MTERTEPSLAELRELLERRPSAGDARADALAAVSRARDIDRASHAHLERTVAQARAHGVPWQAIGEVFGITRQAAFTRFGSATAGPAGEPGVHAMGTPLIDLNARTEQVFTSLSEGDYDAVKALMTFTCARALPKRKLMAVWDSVVTETGRLESLSDTTLQTSDGTNVVTQLINQYLSGGLTGQTQLNHEAGEWIGRVAYSGAGKITGMLIVHPMQAQNLPF